MLHLQVLRDQLMLRADVVVECHQGKGTDVFAIRGGSGLPVAEQCGNDDEVLLRIESLAIANEPYIIVDCLGKFSSYMSMGSKTTDLLSTMWDR